MDSSGCSNRTGNSMYTSNEETSDQIRDRWYFKKCVCQSGGAGVPHGGSVHQFNAIWCQVALSLRGGSDDAIAGVDGDFHDAILVGLRQRFGVLRQRGGADQWWVLRGGDGRAIPRRFRLLRTWS